VAVAHQQMPVELEAGVLVAIVNFLLKL